MEGDGSSKYSYVKFILVVRNMCDQVAIINTLVYSCLQYYSHSEGTIVGVVVDDITTPNTIHNMNIINKRK